MVSSKTVEEAANWESRPHSILTLPRKQNDTERGGSSRIIERGKRRGKWRILEGLAFALKKFFLWRGRKKGVEPGRGEKHREHDLQLARTRIPRPWGKRLTGIELGTVEETYPAEAKEGKIKRVARLDGP